MRIALTRSKTTLIDDEDFDLVMSVNKRWVCTCTRGIWYAQAYRDYSTVNMHRVIMGEPEGMDVHHRNGDTLDNRRSNLAILTRQEHSYTKVWPNKTGFRGVSFEPERNKYVAHIRMKDGKQVKLGRFETPEEAALAYDNAAKIRDSQ